MEISRFVRQTICPILAAFVWGISFSAQDICADNISLNTFNLTRFFIAFLSILLLVFCVDKIGNKTYQNIRDQWLNKNLLIGGIICGFILFFAGTFQQAGMIEGTDSGKAGFITAMYVVLVPVISIFLKRKPGIRVWISVLLAVVSLYLLSVQDDFSFKFSDLLLIINAFGFAFHILAIDYFSNKCDGIKLSCLQFLFAGIFSTLLLLFSNEIYDLNGITSCVWQVMYMGVISAGIGYTLQIIAQVDSNPTIVSILLSLESVFAVIGGTIILNQLMTGREYAGCILMFIAVILSQIPSKNKNKN